MQILIHFLLDRKFIPENYLLFYDFKLLGRALYVIRSKFT
jgi:hypothetical protein